jgi:hypothetical protein
VRGVQLRIHRSKAKASWHRVPGAAWYAVVVTGSHGRHDLHVLGRAVRRLKIVGVLPGEHLTVSVGALPAVGKPGPQGPASL